jgi:antirestriction protein ArdC
MSRDIYADVTDIIVRALENCDGHVTLPWQRGISNSLPVNIESGNHYQGINVLSLWLQAHDRQFTQSVWGTYRQWQNVGAQVRKGEKGSLIIFYKELTREDDQGEAVTIPMLRASTVFNCDQVDGFTGAIEDHGPVNRLEEVDAFIAKTGAVIIYGGSVACYRPSTDVIHIPDEGRFVGRDHETRMEGFYSVKLHELTHWTAHPTRLDRDLKNRFGSEAYAMEELIAELGAAFLCAKLGISIEPREDHAAYIANWLQVLKNDKKAVFTAAAKAQEAVNFLHAL